MPVADAPVAAGGGLWLLLGVLLPVLAVTATAFAKITVVLGVLRGGLGLPEVLPAPVLTGLAALLAAVVMLPTAQRAAEAAGAFEGNAAGYADAAARAWPVWEGFLEKETRAEDLAAVRGATSKLDPARPADAPPSPPERILAFLVSELGAAFQLALAVLLPFLIIDLLASHTLAVIGFHLLPPSVVALPFKLLLFVAVGGWSLLVRGLIGTYA